MKKFFTVKEFSELAGIEQSTLRYWDEIELFSPAKRGPDNNYRYYSAEQMIAVNFITVLSSLNIPLKKINELVHDRSPENIIDLIERQEKRLDMDMRRLRECYSIIHARLGLIKEGMLLCINEDNKDIYMVESGVRIKHMEEITYILSPPNNFSDGMSFYEPFVRFSRQAKDLRINLNFPIGGYHVDLDAFLSTPNQPEYFFSIDPTGNRVRSAGKYMVGFTRGYYGVYGDLPERMAVFAEKNALAVSGPVYSIYLHDEVCLKDPSRYLAQICVAVSQ